MKKIVTIIGRSNVGKSTLFNNLLKKNFSIVTPMRYTTNRCVESKDKNKIIYIDTPGPILKKAPSFYYNINRLIYSAIFKSDILLIVVTRYLNTDDFFILNLIKSVKKIKILIINKIDKLKNKKDLLPFTYNMSKYTRFTHIIPISNKNSDNINRVRTELINVKKFSFNNNFIKINSSKLMVLDIVRKAILIVLKKEIPYNMNIIIENNTDIRKIYLLNLIFVVKKYKQKKIIIGKAGANIKRIIKQLKLDISYLYSNIKKIKIKIKL